MNGFKDIFITTNGDNEDMQTVVDQHAYRRIDMSKVKLEIRAIETNISIMEGFYG